MSKRTDKMYGNSPKMDRDETGKMDVKKHPDPKESKEAGTEGEVREGVPVHARHAMERLDMHHRHEHEHHTHDHGEHGDKKEMHERHLKEHRDMMKRHEKEDGATGGKMIDKVESDDKEGGE